MASDEHNNKTPDGGAPRKNSGRKAAAILSVIVGAMSLIYGVFAVFSEKPKTGAVMRTDSIPPVASAALSESDGPPPTEPVEAVSTSSRGEGESEKSALSAPAPLGHSLAITNIYNPDRRTLFWWGDVPSQVSQSRIDTGELSNIRPKDYTGPQACLKCHPSNHKNWMSHAHRRMNALATPENVVGDFSGKAQIDYLGGQGEFYRKGDSFFMRLKRDAATRVYGIERTIGSRFFQYYVGKLVEGGAATNSKLRSVEHILPFGYWIDQKEWVPTVHVFRESRVDDDHFDPFAGDDFVAYDQDCASCHTTLAAGDWMMRTVGARRVSQFTPRSLLFDVPGYLKDRQPDFVETGSLTNVPLEQAVSQVSEGFREMSVRKHAVTLGISCEACHNGCQQHIEASAADESQSLPLFFPASEHLYIRGRAGDVGALGLNDRNRNFACSKCHSGERPPYADGQHTWNSTEFSDAVKGACYISGAAHSERGDMKTLTCVHCHNPHKGIGKKWALTPAQDDASCVSCHKQFEKPAAVEAHTHHGPGSAGGQCMNCHMPKLNEGMQDMVRSHRITKPTGRRMIEANHPNACNLCHLDKPIDWTIKHLVAWYGEEHRYSEAELKANYPDREGPVGLGWIKSAHGPTRLAAAEALAKARIPEALPALFNLLATDPYLINRQFTQKNLDEWLSVKLKDEGYQFYMTEAERRAALKRLQDDESFKRRVSEAVGRQRRNAGGPIQ